MKHITGAQVLAVGGIASAAVSALGGLLLMPRIIGIGALTMLLANVVALMAERRSRA